MLREYPTVYMPQHHKAKQNGCVYQHVLIAEQKLGRPLNPNECIHHIDNNPNNNVPENIMVFASNSDHMGFHKGNVAVQQDSGSYIAIGAIHSCPVCGRRCSNKQIACSLACKFLASRHTLRPSKDELQQLILVKSVAKIAKQFMVSDHAIRYWLGSYGLPYYQEDIKRLRQVRMAEASA